MKLTRLITMMLLLFVARGFAQPPAADEQKLLLAVSNSRTDQTKGRAYLDLGEFYRTKPGEDSADMQASLHCFSQAEKYAAQGTDQRLMDAILLARSKTYMESSKLDSAEIYIGRIKDKNPDVLANLSWVGSLYLNRPGTETDDIANALRISRQITEIGKQAKSRDIYNQALYSQGAIYMELNDWTKYRQLAQLMHFAMASEHYRRASEFFYLNINWHRPYLDSALTYAALCVSAANAGGTGEAPLIAQRMMYFRQMIDEYRDTPEAEKTLLSLLNTYTANKWPGSHALMAVLSDHYTYKGNFAKGAYYAEESIKNMEKEHAMEYVGVYYLRLGQIYGATGEFTKALEAYKTSRNYFNNERSKPSIYTVIESATTALRKMRRYDEALALLQKTLKEAPLEGNYEKAVYYRAMTNIYRDMKRYGDAEAYVLKLIDMAAKDSSYSFMAYHAAGQLYTESGKYENAQGFLDAVLKKWPNIGAVGMAHLHFMLFRVDSARGNYISAINHLLINKSLDDSILTDTKVKQVAALKVQYETERKDKDLLLQQKNIDLLKQQQQLGVKDLEQARLQLKIEEDAQQRTLALAQEADANLKMARQHMELLRKDSLLQQSYVRQSDLIRNFTLAGIALSLLIMGLLFFQYRSKQRVNKEISHKNNRLEHLVKEKEWLLQEVHHRVKNNLQTVVSLLESQASYLDDTALQALNESRNRVYAMSLIHQKLYQESNMSMINMGRYFPELIEYLRSSFTQAQYIRFEIHIAGVEVDVSQAIPLGLILNEAITNAIKYAFPEAHPGEDCIAVSLVPRHNRDVELVIADNGIGLPADISTRPVKSLGLRLIQGLAEEIDSRLSISSDNGTQIQLVFTPTLLLQLEKQDLAGMKL